MGRWINYLRTLKLGEWVDKGYFVFIHLKILELSRFLWEFLQELIQVVILVFLILMAFSFIGGVILAAWHLIHPPSAWAFIIYFNDGVSMPAQTFKNYKVSTIIGFVASTIIGIGFVLTGMLVFLSLVLDYISVIGGFFAANWVKVSHIVEGNDRGQAR